MAQNRRRGGFGMAPMNLTGPGTIFTIGFIALAIGMGLLLSRGITPKSMLSDPGETGELEVIDETAGPGKKGLGLRTIKFKECASTVTINLLLDRSNSMNRPTPSGATKISRLQEAVLGLVSTAQDESIIGFQSFSQENPTNDLPISYYKDVKSILPSRLDGITSRQMGNTWTYTAIAYSRDVLRDAIAKFPADRKFTFIFVSDGAPNPKTQDPTLFTPNPVDEIKAMGVNVYALGIYDGNESLDPALSSLMKKIASTPENYFAANNADDTKRLLSQISQKICGSQSTPTPTP